jgi:hypothetical protein
MHRGVLGCGGCGVACRCGGVGGKWQSNREHDVHRPPNSTPFSYGLIRVHVPAYAHALSFSAHSLRGHVKGTHVTLLFPYLHRPARQGEVFASLFVKLPTTGAASAESYDLYSQLGVLRILSRNCTPRQRAEVT